MKNKTIKNKPSLMDSLYEHLENIRPCNKPSAEAINAAGKASSVVNSAVRYATLVLRAAQSSGRRADLSFIGIQNEPAALAEKN